LIENKTTVALFALLFLLPVVLPLSSSHHTGGEMPAYGDEPSPEHVYDEIQGLPWYRYLDSPGHRDAEQHIAAKFNDYGLEVSRQEYIGQRPDGEVRCVNILGYLEGEEPDIWLVIGAHYDTNIMASQGAYDNGAGVATVLELVRLFTQVENQRPLVSIMFATWDAEEGGGAGSSHFVENLPEGVDVAAYINLDMFGLNYPVRNSFNYLPTSSEEYFRLYMYTSPVEDFSGYDEEYSEETLEGFMNFRTWVEEISYEDWQYPEEWVVALDDTETNSDQKFFIRKGIPSVWFRGMHENAWEEGDTNEQTFKHTPIDTLATMEAYAGGRTNLLQGLETPLRISYDLCRKVAGTGESSGQEDKDGEEFLDLSGISGRELTAVAVVSLFLAATMVMVWKKTRKEG